MKLIQGDCHKKLKGLEYLPNGIENLNQIIELI